MADEFREVIHQTWIGRLVSSFKSVVIGLVFVAIGVVALFWNEGRAVKTAKGLHEGAAHVITVDPTVVTAPNEGALVHFTAQATTAQMLTDPAFSVSQPALKLRRKVEMYQWKETKSEKTEKNLGGSSTTNVTYSYEKLWSDHEIDSSKFKQPDHSNPDFTLPNQTWTADPISVAAFTLGRELADQINNFEAIPTPATSPSAPTVKGLPAGFAVKNGVYYSGADASKPQIGDVRVTLQMARPALISVVAQQRASMLVPMTTSQNTQIALLEMGSKDAKAMFATAQAANARLTWIIRLVGLIALWIGLCAIFSPLSTFADVIPFLGDLLSAGTAVMAGILAVGLGLIVIAVAWLTYRPLLGIGLIAVAVAGFIWLKKIGAAKKLAKATAAATTRDLTLAH